MSIEDVILEQAKRGELSLLVPLLGTAVSPRLMLVTKELRAQIDPPAAPELGRVRFDIDRFSNGGVIEWNYLKPLKPRSEQVWEIKSIHPKPGYRAFGRFARRNIFVATHCEKRTVLGTFRSIFWKREIRHCKQIWNRLFGTLSPHSGTSIHDYVTGAIKNPAAYK